MRNRIKYPLTTWSLRATLTIAFLTFGVLALLISNGLQLFFSLQTQQDIISSTQHLIAQQAAKSVSSFVLDKYSVMETVNKMAEPATASAIEQKLMLDSLLGLQPAFSKLILLNAQDQLLVQSTRLPQSTSGQFTDQLNGDLLAKVHQRERYISQVYIDPANSEPMVIMAIAMTDVFGDFKGSLIAEVYLKSMWDMVAQLKVGESGHAYVVDRQGNLIAFNDMARVLKGENLAALETVSNFIRTSPSAQTAGVSLYRGITEVMVVGTYTGLGMPDWAVVTELPWEEAYREVIRQVVVSIGITLAMAVIAGLLGVYVARRLDVPLIHLMETSTRIAGGERELQADISGPKEVASLAIAFNSMTAQLQQSLQSLEEQVVEVKRAEESLRQANETLQVSERNYRGVFNATSDALLIHDEKARVLDINDRMCTMFGYDHETALSLSVGDLSQGNPPYSQFDAEVWVRRAVQEGPQVYEWYSKRFNGELFWSEVALYAGEVGGERRVIASIRDITERKKAEQALRESEEKLRQITSSLREVIWLRDAYTRQVLYVNPAFEELTGRTCENFYENPDIVINAIHPDDKASVVKALSQRSEKAPYHEEHRIIHQNGSVHWVTGRSFPVKNEAGEVYRWTTIMENITERKQAEEQIQRLNEELEQRVVERTEQLQTANKELEAFAYSISHDLRAPLRAINGFTQILLEEYAPSLDQEVKDICLTICAGATRMGNLIDDLLNFSRLGRAEMKTSVVDMYSLVNSVYQSLTAFVMPDHILFNLAPLPEAQADSTLIRQVWENLIANALKFSRYRDPALIEVGSSQDEKEITYWVKDNGAGFDMQYAVKLFGVFQRLHSEKEFEGTGVGLAIVQRIIQRHGGRVWARSEINHGATFYFTLPVIGDCSWNERK